LSCGYPACHRQGAAYRLLGLRLRDNDVETHAALAIVRYFWVDELTESVVRLGIGIIGHRPDRARVCQVERGLLGNSVSSHVEAIDDERRRQKTVQRSRLLIAVLMGAKGLPVLHKKNEPEAVSLLRSCIYTGGMSHSSSSQCESLRVIDVMSHDESHVVIQW
jgi:hypothetical protein